MTDPDAGIVDPARCAQLWDVGNHDYLAAVVVEADGTERLVLAEKASMGDPDAYWQPDCPDARHEKLGPLPEAVAARLAGRPRCGWPNRHGRPCRVPVTMPGDACPWHRKKAALDLLAEILGAKVIDGDEPPS